MGLRGEYEDAMLMIKLEYVILTKIRNVSFVTISLLALRRDKSWYRRSAGVMMPMSAAEHIPMAPVASGSGPEHDGAHRIPSDQEVLDWSFFLVRSLS